MGIYHISIMCVSPPTSGELLPVASNAADKPRHKRQASRWVDQPGMSNAKPLVRGELRLVENGDERIVQLVVTENGVERVAQLSQLSGAEKALIAGLDAAEIVGMVGAPSPQKSQDGGPARHGTPAVPGGKQPALSPAQVQGVVDILKKAAPEGGPHPNVLPYAVRKCAVPVCEAPVSPKVGTRDRQLHLGATVGASPASVPVAGPLQLPVAALAAAPTASTDASLASFLHGL